MLEEIEEQKAEELRRQALEARKALAEDTKRRKDEEELEKRRKLMEKMKAEEETKRHEAAQRAAKRAKDEARFTSIPSALAHIESSYGLGRLHALCQLVSAIVTKIMANPQEAKYRSINMDKEKVQKALVRPLGGLVIMRMLGFKEQDGHLVMSKPDLALLKRNLPLFQTAVKRQASAVPKIWSEVDEKTTPVELRYFVLLELHNILYQAAAAPDVRDCRTVDTKPDSFKSRVGAIPQATQILSEFGFKPSTNGFLVCDGDIDEARFQAGLLDIKAEIDKLAPHTPMFKLIVAIAKRHGVEVMDDVVNRLHVAVNRILDTPYETKFHRVRLDKFFKSSGPIENGSKLFSRLGFKVDVVEQMAVMPYPVGFDPELLTYRRDDMLRAREFVLQDARKRREVQQLKEEEQERLKRLGEVAPMDTD